MRLSDALVLGIGEIFLTNACWYHPRKDGTCYGCLVGTVLLAVGETDDCHAIASFERRWPWTVEWVHQNQNCGGVKCPFCTCHIVTACNMGSMFTHFVHHYKDGDRTIEQIADWVRSVEPPEDEPIASKAAVSSGCVELAQKGK